MKNNSRLYNLLAAGSLTVLLFLTFLLFRGNQLGAVNSATASALTGTTMTPLVNASTVNPTPGSEQVSTAQDQALTALQAQNAKLVQALQVMEERERQYQSQLNAANQALQTPQAQPGAQRDEQHAQGDDAQEGFGEHDHAD